MSVTSHGGAARLRFLGGAGSVTGSRFLIESRAGRVLVDCGLYQGLKPLRLRNWLRFPIEPSRIDAVILTHAHVDHCGYLPALVRDGFRGPVFATEGTSELCRIVLRDSGRLHEEDAAFANREHFSRHEPALPLYTERDAEAALTHFAPQPCRTPFDAGAGMQARFLGAGHILGSALVALRLAEGSRVVVSGDLGRPEHPLLVPPAPPPAADALLVESTYGDREHAGPEVLERFAAAIARTAERGGVVVIPAFAVDRTELVLLALRRLEAEGRIPRLPIFVDSPMALAALAVYRRAIEEGWEEIRPELRGRASPFDSGNVVEARSVSDSRAIHEVSGPAIIVSASGMATGGRVLHHLERRLPEARNSVILVGFQAQGSRGRRLLEGEKAVKMHGIYVPVRAEIVEAGAFSVHADQSELLDWLGAAEAPPAMTYVVHGEPAASRALREAIAARLGWPAVVPTLDEQVRITPAG